MPNKSKQIILKFSTDSKNTGLPEVQIAFFTEYINNLTIHMKNNRHDYQAKKSLLTFVVRRKRLLLYLKSRDNRRYEKLVKNLKLRGV